MSEAARVEWVKIAAVVGTAWATFRVVGVVVTTPMGMVASRFSPRGAAWVPPVLLAIWFLLAGVATGLVSRFVIRSVPGGMPAALVGILVGVFAFVAYGFSGSSAGQAGEQAIRVVCSGLSAAMLFALSSQRQNRAAA